MSKEPRYAWIGTFVVGAVCVLVAAIAFFGRGRLFEHKGTYIAFFSGSVKGLQVGAPVSFRGARVGTVKDVSIVYKADRDELIIPVLVELDADSIQGLNAIDYKKEGASEGKIVSRLIEKGLRARLGLDSIVTGQLFVQLDFMPNVPMRLMAADDEDYLEIPTAPSPLEKLQQTLEEIPFDELARKTVNAIEKIEQLLSSPDVQNSFHNLDALLVELKAVVSNIDTRSDGVSRELKIASVELTKTLEAVQKTLVQGDPLLDRTSAALDEISSSAQALRRLADYLEQHPETLLRGKN
jgi:paraquat-inducible protein B